jgi:hypothetical protein
VGIGAGSEWDATRLEAEIAKAKKTDFYLAPKGFIKPDATSAPYLGGIGRYDKTADHGPFVHVDVRGIRVLW